MPENTGEKKDFREKLRDLLEKIDTAASDLTTMEVVTMTGDFRNVIDLGRKDGAKFKIKDMIDNLSQADNVQGDVQLMAFTHIDFDYDTVTFVKKGRSQQDRDLFELHQSTVNSTQMARRAFLHFAKELVYDKPRLKGRT